MHLSIIVETRSVSVDGVALTLSQLNLPQSLVAMHWSDGRGWEEHCVDQQVTVTDISSIEPYRSVLDLYKTQQQKTPEDQLPACNTGLINLVEDALMTIEIMRDSLEWEDFKIATNRV